MLLEIAPPIVDFGCFVMSFCSKIRPSLAAVRTFCLLVLGLMLVGVHLVGVFDGDFAYLNNLVAILAMVVDSV